MREARVLFALLPVLLAGSAQGIEVVEGRLFIDGNGQWGYGRTDHNNSYLLGALEASPDGEFDNTAFALTLTARPLDRVTIFAQPEFEESHDTLSVSLAWTFAEYQVSDLLRIRAGKIKLPFGLSTETRSIGTLRPFFELAPSMYGPTDLTISYRGAGATGAYYGESGWGFGYDVFGGAVTFREVKSIDKLVEPLAAGTEVGQETLEVVNLIGGRLTLFTSVEGLSFRLSAYRGKLEGARFTAAAASAEYLTERWSVRAEAFRVSEKETNRGAYLEVGYSLSQHWQLAGRAEALHTDFPAFGGDSSLLRHRDLAAGLNYWIGRNLVFKLAYHNVDGNRLAFPLLLDDALIKSTLQSTTNVLTLGTQFTL